MIDDIHGFWLCGSIRLQTSTSSSSILVKFRDVTIRVPLLHRMQTQDLGPCSEISKWSHFHSFHPGFLSPVWTCSHSFAFFILFCHVFPMALPSFPGFSHGFGRQVPLAQRNAVHHDRRRGPGSVFEGSVAGRGLPRGAGQGSVRSWLWFCLRSGCIV